MQLDYSEEYKRIESFSAEIEKRLAFGLRKRVLINDNPKLEVTIDRHKIRRSALHSLLPSFREKWSKEGEGVYDIEAEFNSYFNKENSPIDFKYLYVDANGRSAPLSIDRDGTLEVHRNDFSGLVKTLEIRGTSLATPLVAKRYFKNTD